MISLKAGWILCIVSAVVSSIVLLQIPSGLEIPLQWGLDGQPNRFGPAWQALFIPPIVIALVLVIFSSLQWIEPRKVNLNNSLRALNGITMGIILMMLILQVGFVALVYGNDIPMQRLAICASGLLFIVLGNFLSKTRSNFFIGIRTPWTLSSDEIWKKTHYLGSRLFMISGLVMLITSWVIDQNYLVYIVLATVLPAVLITVFYSWWLWHKSC